MYVFYIYTFTTKEPTETYIWADSSYIHWIAYVLAYLNFVSEFQSSFSTAQNGPLCPDT